MTEKRERPDRRRRRWPLVLLAVLAAVSLMLHAVKRLRQGEVQGLCDQEAMWRVTRPVEETKARRAHFYQVRYFLGYPMAASHAAADLVRRVGAVTLPLQLRSVQVDPGVNDLGFELTVEISGASSREVRRRLGAFLERLRDVPGITMADLSGQGPSARGGGKGVFIVNGHAEIQP